MQISPLFSLPLTPRHDSTMVTAKHSHVRSKSVPIVVVPAETDRSTFSLWKSPFKRLRPSSIVSPPSDPPNATRGAVRASSPVKASSPIKLSNPFPFFKSKVTAESSSLTPAERTGIVGGTLRRKDKLSGTGLSMLSAQRMFSVNIPNTLSLTRSDALRQ